MSAVIIPFPTKNRNRITGDILLKAIPLPRDHALDDLIAKLDEVLLDKSLAGCDDFMAQLDAWEANRG